MLPREWTRVFLKKLVTVNKFYCIAFVCHSLCIKSEYLLTTPDCTITGCSMKGQLFLYPNMKLIVKHNPNRFLFKTSARLIQISKYKASFRESLRQSLIDCPFPSKEFHKKLGDLAECNFNSG